MPNDRPLIANDDAPIIIGDTSIPITDTSIPITSVTKDETTISHKAGKGNTDHYHKNSKNHFFVHDKENGNGQDYRAVCFDFASLPNSIPIPANATSWEILFQDKDDNQVLSLNWVADLTGEKESGDVTLDANGAAQNGTDKTLISLAVRVATMTWSIDQGPISGPIYPTNDKKLVTVHYCPGGICAVNPCR